MNKNVSVYFPGLNRSFLFTPEEFESPDVQEQLKNLSKGFGANMAYLADNEIIVEDEEDSDELDQETIAFYIGTTIGVVFSVLASVIIVALVTLT